MNQSTRNVLKKTFFPLYFLYRKYFLLYAQKHPMRLADKIYFKRFGKHINWNNPQSLNEKIQWLKFHADQHEWGRLADKYAVRKYIEDKGLKDLLPRLYGKWDSPEEVIAAWDSLPEEFVLKCNTGCGMVLVVNNENNLKHLLTKKDLSRILKRWFAERHYNLTNAELHYQFINNCVFAEELIKDDSVKDFSQSLIDYKIWCFNGVPYGCLLVFDRAIGSKHYILDFYDNNWMEKTDLMSDKTPRHSVPKPVNYDLMLQYAAIISSGHPQIRVDFYNIDGKIYFGEMTFTSQGGFMDYFSDEMQQEMGDQISLDYKMTPNEFYENI